MSQDVILGSTNRNWSRSDNSLVLTDEEKTRIERLAKLDMLATNGDPEAIKKVAQVNAALTALQIKAKRGDAKAKRIIATLMPTGMVLQIAKTTKQGIPRLALAGDESGAWLHKLSPRYWLKSKEERMFEDIERNKWGENAKLNKAMAKRKLALEQGLKAQQAAEAVKSARSQSSETDAQIEALAAALQGDADVGFNGHLAYIRGLGEEEVALAMEGGQCERDALSRRSNIGARFPRGMGKMRSKLSPAMLAKLRQNKKSGRGLTVGPLTWSPF